jgi:hypothetical protein
MFTSRMTQSASTHTLSHVTLSSARGSRDPKYSSSSLLNQKTSHQQTLVSTRRLLSMIGPASKTVARVPSFLQPQLKKFEYEILLDCMQRWRRFAKVNRIEEGIVENLDRQRRFRILRNTFYRWVKRCEMFSRRRKEDILFDYFRKK